MGWEIYAEWIDDVAKQDSVIRKEIIAAVFASIFKQATVFDRNMSYEFHINEVHNEHENVEDYGEEAIKKIVVDPLIVLRDFSVLIVRFLKILIKTRVIANFWTHLSLLYTHDKSRAMRLTRTMVAPVGVPSM